jgi:hypothetical protein
MSEKSAKAVLKALGGDFTHIKDGNDHFIGHEEDDAFGHKITSGEGGKIITQGANISSTGDEYDAPVTHENAEAAAKHIKKSFLGEGTKLQETLAADSIAPKGNAAEVGQLPKSAAMAHVMGMMQGMDNPNLHNFMLMLQQYGPHNSWGVDPAMAQHNQATIAMKPSAAPASGVMAAEDLEIAFEGEDLTEEFKTKASTIFEAAVNAKVIAETARLEEEFEATITEQIETFTEELTSKLDSYLDYAVNEWMEENQVAIESTLQTELTHDFINGLKNLFAEHYIEVPADKIDVLESMAEKVAILETKLDEMITENSELRGVIIEESAKDLIESVSSDLALTQKDKFYKIAEGLEFDGNLEVFEEKLKVIKESYFGEKQPKQESNILEESFEGEIEESTRYTDPSVGRYVEAISRSVKK